MMLFLIVAPFGTLALLMLVASAPVSLFGAAAVALAVIAFDLAHGRSIKVLPAGTAILFAALGCYVALVDGEFSRSAIRFTIDAGVLAIALISIALRAPFTLQYAREHVDAETAELPGFLHANYIITYVWTAAFVLMLITDMLMIYAPSLSLWIGLAIAFAARNAAAYFTKWYPDYRRAQAARLAKSS